MFLYFHCVRLWKKKIPILRNIMTFRVNFRRWSAVSLLPFRNFLTNGSLGESAYPEIISNAVSACGKNREKEK